VTRLRHLLLGLLLLAGVLIPSAARGGAVGGGGDDPPRPPSTSPPLGRFLALAAVTPTQTVFRPTDDTYSSAANPATTHGSSTSLKIDGDPTRRGYVRMVVAGLGLGDRITRVTLRFYPRTGNSSGFEVRTVDPGWSEKTLTHLNAPTPSVTVAARSGALTSGTWKSIDVTSLIAGNGTYAFALTTSRSSSLELASKEAGSSRAPQLVVQTAPNEAPAAGADSAAVDEDATLTIPASTLLANDTDPEGDPLQLVSVAAQPDTNGSVALADGAVTFVPHANFNGAASFTYTVADDHGGTANGSVSIAVAGVNDAPVCENAMRSTPQGVAVAAEGLCSDVDGEALSYSVASAPFYGTLTMSESGASYLPELAATHGTARNDSFSLRATDAAGSAAIASVAMRVAVRPGDLALPTRAAFYYPWFPEAWKQQGFNPFTRYTPGYESPFYSSSNADAVRAHVRALDYGNFDVGIASWWGPGGKFESERIPLLLNTTAELGSDLKWTLYYEAEGRDNPSVEALQADFAYIRANYATHPNYARVDGKPVLFVYSVDDLTCELTARWAEATAGAWYVVLNVFPGFAGCPVQPDAWHQYGPAQAVRSRLPHSYNVSPGFWRPDETAPRLARDLTRFDQNIRDMIASGARWQLVTSFNEWGEGTPVENAQDWLSLSGHGAYLDVLHAHEDGGGG
jgi:cadherin-like protein/glycosyl hydrolase family 99/Big-like domain-containing protein